MALLCTQVKLTDEELNLIAYPYPMFIHNIHLIGETKTIYAPDGKAFTVGQLAEGITKAEKENVDKHDQIGMFGGGWYFEGYDRGDKPHMFSIRWGTSMASSRGGMYHVGIGFNHINTRENFGYECRPMVGN